MQKKTRSLLEELQSLGDTRDTGHLIESRAKNVIASAINLLELVQEHFSKEQAELLEKKLLSSIKSKDAARFAKSLRKINENK